MSQITSPKYDIEELANTMIALLDGWNDKWVSWIKVHKLLLEGKPVSSERKESQTMKENTFTIRRQFIVTQRFRTFRAL